ncbi:TIGR03086 family metal-binding protein [Mycobacterium xenopi]|uniref:TIGR03086 family protein n=1 Tax=Mycobacterium xenopi TaxID=1789 RepID=A0AAD1GXH5_MYCXE|nr:TIGR03086 family metal-binding protein [Mycobacterium xenopi]MDA3641205.1 TIGR03086 family metal-binding protein [Mycobacterium xenopi]MDA3659005.1 TIGR03086 family metal-binding protein [Mycobacterium xenopi]ORX19978.1 ArsR family transcriptional regulator [Mycobacterium xenopi]SPX79598.1 TIGR03086 family protein [Mycobacterium xenopi]BBU20490.1 TIGR03086 family protein [Mycobacterium xenopi]
MPSDLRPGPDSPPTDELDSAEETLGVLQRVLHPISRDDLSCPTPCSEFDVAQLTDHLLNSITTIGGVVGAEFPPRDADNSVERQVVAAARPALDSWHRRGLQGTVKLGSTEAPAKAFAGVLSIEFLVHAWDYATATGRDVDAPDSLAEYVLELARTIITPSRRVNAGFDDPVDVPADAGPLDRLIAFTGRHPR